MKEKEALNLEESLFDKFKSLGRGHVVRRSQGVIQDTFGRLAFFFKVGPGCSFWVPLKKPIKGGTYTPTEWWWSSWFPF